VAAVTPDKQHEYETEDDDVDQSVGGGPQWDDRGNGDDDE
jgi:hypothetical protein